MANSTVADLKVSRSAITGAIFWAPAGTALPTDATTALPAAFRNLGHVGDGGISPARDVSTDDVNDMNGDRLLVLQTGYSKSYSAPMLAVLNEDLNSAIFGDANVTVAPATAEHGRTISVVDTGTVADQGVLVIELRNGNAGRERRVAAVAQVTAAEEGDLVGTAVQTFTLTWSVYKDDEGVYERKYVDDGVTAGV